jgi:hypothetical protein
LNCRSAWRRERQQTADSRVPAPVPGTPPDCAASSAAAATLNDATHPTTLAVSSPSTTAPTGAARPRFPRETPQTLVDVRVSARGSVPPGARFGFGSAGRPRNPLKRFAFRRVGGRCRRGELGIGSVGEVRSRRPSKRRYESSTFEPTFRPTPVLLIRRSEVRALFGEPYKSWGCVGAAQPLFISGVDRRMLGPRVHQPAWPIWVARSRCSRGRRRLGRWFRRCTQDPNQPGIARLL